MMAWIDGLSLLWSIGFFWMLAILRTLIAVSYTHLTLPTKRIV